LCKSIKFGALPKSIKIIGNRKTMSLTLEKVLDPKRLARDDYDLPKMLKRLIRQEEGKFNAMVNKRKEQGQWGPPTQAEEAMKKEINNLRARSDLLSQLNLVSDEEALQLLEEQGNPTKLSWKPRMLDDVQQMEENLNFARMQKEVEARRQGGGSVAVEVDDRVVDSKQERRVAKSTRKPKSAEAALKPLQKAIKDRVIPRMIAEEEGALAKGGFSDAQVKKRVKQMEARVYGLLRLDAMIVRVLQAPDKVTAKQWSALQTALEKAKGMKGVPSAKLAAAIAWVEGKGKASQTTDVLPASVAVAKTNREKRMVRNLKRAGASTEKGTCPLGPAPEGKTCVRGFWKVARKGKNQ
jgi:hypothetical protein